MPNNKMLDYGKIRVPDKEEKIDPATYNYQVRRAEILGLIEGAGHPGALSPTRLAVRYGVSHGQICQDIKELKKYLAEIVGTDMRARTHLVFNKVVRDLLDGSNQDKYHAAVLMGEWNKWLFDIGEQRRVPQELNINSQSKELSLKDEFEEFKKLQNGADSSKK